MFRILNGCYMSTIQTVSENIFFEDKGLLDAYDLQSKALGSQTALIHSFCSGVIVALAEATHYIGYATLFGLSFNFLGIERVCFHYAVAGFFKLLQNKTYTKDDIEQFDNRTSYLQYFKEKTDHITHLSAKDQMFWLWKESFANTIFKVMAAAIILKSPAHFVLRFSATPYNLLRFMALGIGLSYVNKPFYQLLDYAEKKMYSFVYHKAQHQQMSLSN